jgi:nucleotide-binding universal stress UspA family protein
MYERILVAIDDSAVSERVLAAAGELAGLSKAKVWVLHLRERELSRLGGVESDESDSDATVAVNAAVKTLIEMGVDAQRHDVKVIVMGSRGRSDLAGLVLGSTAHKVIHLADRPVLVVR